MSAPGGYLVRGSAPGGVSAPGGLVSQHALRQNPPVNRMTNRCKNITLATTSLRPVIKTFTRFIKKWNYDHTKRNKRLRFVDRTLCVTAEPA